MFALVTEATACFAVLFVAVTVSSDGSSSVSDQSGLMMCEIRLILQNNPTLVQVFGRFASFFDV